MDHLIVHVIISLSMHYHLDCWRYVYNDVFISMLHFITYPLECFILIVLNACSHHSQNLSTSFGAGTMSKHAFFSFPINFSSP